MSAPEDILDTIAQMDDAEVRGLLSEPVSMVSMRCSSCGRPWCATGAAATWPCPFCGDPFCRMARHL